MEAYLHAALCMVGFTLTLVRLRIVARPHPTLKCRLRWALWVSAHALWCIGFFAGMVQAFGDAHDPSFPAWPIRVGLVLWLLLKIRHEPETGK